jgi:hypothetical protein
MLYTKKVGDLQKTRKSGSIVMITEFPAASTPAWPARRWSHARTDQRAHRFNRSAQRLR